MITKPTTAELLDRCLRFAEAERQYAIIAPQLDWAMLESLEPQLSYLLDCARTADSIPETEQFCGQSFWYDHLKPQLVALVGYCRPDIHPILSTSAAYELAYHTLWKAAPPCRNCACAE